MLEQEAEKKQDDTKPAPTTDPTDPSISLVEANKKRVKLGSIIGGGIFLLLLIIIIVLVATSSPTPLPPKPQPKEIYHPDNPFRIFYVHHEDPKHMLVTIVNERQTLEKNSTDNSTMPKTIINVKNTTENAEPPVLQVSFIQMDEHLINIRYNDTEWPRWEVPHFARDYDPYIHVSAHAKSPIGVGIQEKPDKIFEWSFFGKSHDMFPLMTTEHCRLQYFDKYLEFEARLQTDFIYGMGERVESFTLKNGNYSLWNRDTTYDYDNNRVSQTGTYGSHPFFLNRLRDKKDFIGVFMRNSNAMLFSFWNTMHNGTIINYKMIGGIVDLFVFHEADPDYILKKYHSLIGRPYLPPVWGMGFHQARRGYNLAKMKEVVKAYQDKRIPIESIWADVDLADGYKTFTVDSKNFEGIKEFVKELHDPHGGIDMKFVVLTNPGLKKEQGYKYYDEAKKADCLIKSAAYHEEAFEGRTMAGQTVWLDFFMREAFNVWVDGLHDLRELTDYDGVWISENEISNQCDGECRKQLIEADGAQIPNPFHNVSEFDYIQYRPTLDPLERSTLSMSAYQCCDPFFTKQYYTHNLYGLQVTEATFNALHGIFEDKRFLVVSRSTWPGSGHFGSHWLGDNYATWNSMQVSIPGILNFNMFGIPHVGAAIGGYFGDTDSELLVRWYELGAMYPLMLSYTGSGANPKEAYADPTIMEYIKTAIVERYGLLRFMYTQMFEAFAWGGAVVHPLFFDFPNDETTYDKDVIDTSFMWGKTLYVIPALIKGQVTTKAYLPNWRWYDLRSGEMIMDYREGFVGDYKYFEQPLGHITILVKGGSIVPYQRGARDAKVMNTEDLKHIPALLVIAPDHTGRASGTMVVDAEGIRPFPHPMSHTYRHYAFTYMNQIFRINKLAGFDFHEEYEFDNFWELIILDVFGQHSIDFVCMMDMNFHKKELQFNHFAGSQALMIHDENMAKISMARLESIVWGTKEQHDFCRFQVHVEKLDFPPDEKTVDAVLATSDPESYQLKYDFKAFMLTNQVISVQIKRQDIKNPWIVPDVVDDNVRHTSKATKTIGQSGLRIAHEHEPFYFELSDPIDSHDFIFTTRNMPFVFLRDFIHLKFMVNSRHIFGLGERIGKFDLPDGVYSMFNRDAHNEETGLPPGNNMYGSHPFYVVHLHNPNEFAGVFFLNSNPIDVKIRHVGMQTQIDHIFTGGIVDAFFFQRGSIDEVIKSYQYVVGRPEPLPYWAFGYHQSRWGYRNIDHLKEIMRGFENSNMPVDAFWMDKDYMDSYKDFTIDHLKWAGMKELIASMHSKGIHFVAIVDAAIAVDPEYRTYKEGLERDVYLYSTLTTKPLIGVTWPGYSVWVDFVHPSATKFWEDELQLFHEQVDYDGLWLDMNEPANFCDGECPDGAHYIYYHFPLDYYDDLYYNPTHRGLERGTVSMEAIHRSGTDFAPEYNYHNLYGYLQSRTTARFFYARLHKRPFVVSSATFPGIGRFASHWLGDNHSSWHMMEYSIAGMLNFQLFGIPFVGADICGFDGNATIPLCSRWMQLGAFYPFMRNHNSPYGKPQEPYVDSKLASVSGKAIRLRYSLARYIYSSYMHIVLEGGVLVKPILFDFPTDLKLYDIIDTTFMFGDAIRVTPVLEDRVDTIVAYFPNHDWFDFYTHQKVVSRVHNATQGQNVTLACSLDAEKINLHIKGGSIFPYQEDALAGTLRIRDTWNHTIKLIVAPDHTKTAKGVLFYDSDEDINIFNQEFHDIHMEEHGNELKFVFEAGKQSYDYKYSDNTISEVVIIGAKDYHNVTCAKMTERGSSVEKNVPVKYDATKEEVVIDLKTENVRAHKVEYIRWHDRC